MKNFKYAFMVLLGAAMYGTMSSFVKLMYSSGYSAAVISFSQAFLAALFLGTLLLFTPSNIGKEHLSVKDIVSMLLTGGTIGITNFLYYLSVSYISASLAIVILMQFTWFSLLLEWILFRQRPGKHELWTVFFILVGTFFAGNLVHANSLQFSWWGIGLALASSATYAIYIIANSRARKGAGWQLKSTLIMVGSALTIFIINVKTIVSGHHLSIEFLKWAVFIAVIGTTIPTALFASGIPRIGAGTSSILMTIEFPVAIICAHSFLDEAISAGQIAGITIMLAAISAMNYYKSIKPKEKF